jgi:hypothetical protein
MGLKYYTDDNVRMVKRSFNIDKMLKLLLDYGLIDEISPNYSDNVTDMCNNCCIILANHISMFVPVSQITICEGVFNMMGNHTWINVDGLIFDATLAQFVPSAPKLAVLKENEHYQVVKTYTLRQWLIENDLLIT